MLTNNRGEARVPITKWDAEQLIGFGLSSPASPILDPNGRGNSPWGTASAVAGPQSGYQWAFNRDIYLSNPANLKASIVTGPWNRIQYPGSTIAKDQVGLKSTALGFATADASTLGTALSPASPLPQTLNWTDNTSPKALRVSYGGLVLGQSEYARVQLKILAAPGQPNSPFDANGCFFMNTDAFGGDAGGEQGGKDHLWRYYDPTTQTINTCAMLQKQFAKTPLAPGETSYFEIAVINTGTTALTNVVVTDPMPVGLTYVSAVPAPSSKSPLTWILGTVPAQGFVKIRVNVTAAGSGVIFNTASMNSSAGTRTAMDSVDIGIRSILEPTKSVTPSSTVAGATVTYTITINNIGTGSNGTPLVLTDVLPAGFTYGSVVSSKLNGAAAASGVVSVNGADPTKPIFTISQGIQPGKSLVITMTGIISGSQAPGTYGNIVSMKYEGKVVTSGSLAPVTVGGGRIGDTIFRDWDGDGTQDSSDEGLPGLSVQLWSDLNGDGNTADGALLQTKTTDSSGGYLFSGLAAGNYVVQIPTPPAGYTQTFDPEGPVDNAGKATLALNQEFLTMDFGYKPGGTGSIGDTVFEDLNGDGIINGSDAGIGSVFVKLYEDTNSNGVLDAADALVATTATNAGGIYSFTGLATGLSYLVDVDETDTDLAAAFSPDSYSATTPALRSVLALAGSNLTADFGYKANLPLKIGDTVFTDVNGNGVYDAGIDTPIGNITVTLYRDSNNDGFADGPAISTASTDLAGQYAFTGLAPDTYLVVVSTADPDLPSGYSATVSFHRVTLTSSDVLTADFPFVSIFNKTVDKSFASVGDTLDYTMYPYWPGPSLLTNAKVTDAVPTGTTFASAGQGGTNTAGTVTWNLGTNSAAVPGSHAGGAGSGTVNASADADSWLNGSATSTNYGPDATMRLDTSGGGAGAGRPVLRFDLSAIPSGATIDSASLKLNLVARSVTTNRTVRLYALTQAFEENQVTWTQRLTGTNWTTAGGSYNTTELDNTLVGDLGEYTWTSTSLATQVQTWLNPDSEVKRGIVWR